MRIFHVATKSPREIDVNLLEDRGVNPIEAGAFSLIHFNDNWDCPVETESEKRVLGPGIISKYKSVLKKNMKLRRD